MVVTESMTSSEQMSMNCEQWSAVQDPDNEDSNSDSNSSAKHIATTGRKRTLSDGGNGEDSERELKRRKNREAAKRCRDKKQQQTEQLRQKNGELQKENCMLAKERDELINKCKEYQQEIEQHRLQGCVVPHFNPPYNLQQILSPASPTSSFNESTESPSPALTISTSPGPQTDNRQNYPTDHSNNAREPNSTLSTINGLMETVEISKPTPKSGITIPTAVAPLASAQNMGMQNVRYLRVRNKDGTEKTLILDSATYSKVMQKLEPRLKAGRQQTASQKIKEVSSVLACDSNSQHMTLPQPQKIMTENVSLPQLPQVSHCQTEKQDENPKTDQKLDTFDDLISVLQGNVKSTENGFDLVPVNSQDVHVKQEPFDVDFDQQSLSCIKTESEMTRPKQEVDFRGANTDNMSESNEQFTSTGQQIRAGLDLLTNQDEPESSGTHIQNIVRFLERDEHHPFAPTVSKPSVNQVKQTTVGRATSVGQPAQVAYVNSTTDQGQNVTYITSSATVGSLNKIKADGNRIVGQHSGLPQPSLFQTVPNTHSEANITSGQHYRTIPISSIGTIKLRSCVTGLSAPSTIPGGKLQATKHVGQSTAEIMGQKIINVVMQGNDPSHTAQRQVINLPQDGGSVQTPQGATFFPAGTPSSSTQLTIGHTPSSQIIQQNSAIPVQLLTSAATNMVPTQQKQISVSDNLMSESTSQIMEYLKANGIEALQS